jgi:signal transduction histidine kinase
MTNFSPPADRTGDRRHGARAPESVGGVQALHLRASVIPTAVMALLGVVIVALLLAGNPSARATRILLVCAVVAMLAVLGTAIYTAAGVSRRVHEQLAALRGLTSRSRDDLQRLSERVRHGERPPPQDLEPLPAGEADPFSLLAYDLRCEQRAAEQAVLAAAGLGPGKESDQRVEVFVNLAWRMQSLVHREIQLLDDLEAKVEDPELLKGLFTVDHLATRMRRQSESLAVLGGAVSRRQWTRPVTMHEVLRAAVAEVEQYSRVKVVPPVDGVLQGAAVADVIHLVAELVENATKFSAPHTQVLLRAQSVASGLAIDVEDRGLGMLPADRHRMNGLLADPGLVNISELLRDGRIGLFVVSTLARRHGIKVQLQSNIFGGTQSIVILPASLVEAGQPEHRGQRPEPAVNATAGPATAQATGPRAGQAPLPVRASGRSEERVPTLAGEGRHAGGDRDGIPAAAITSGSLGPLGAKLPPAGTALPPAGPAPRAAGAALPPAGAMPPPPPGRPAPPPAPGRPAPRTPGRAAPPAVTGPLPPVPPTGALPLVPPGSAAPPGRDQRPPLPRRQAQTNLVPELREKPMTRPDSPPAEQLPGLMAAFQTGFSRGEEEGQPPGSDSTR